MPRISRITWPEMKLNYGWLFDIRTSAELFDYLDNVRTPRAQAELAEALKYAKGLKGLAHANMIAVLAEAKGISILDAQLQFNESIMNSMEKVLAKEKQIFVNGSGGYFGVHNGIRVRETKDIDVWALPKEQPRFIQWYGGTHWYAKIGDEDIVVEGKQKWDTKAEAEDAAKQYLKGKRR